VVTEEVRVGKRRVKENVAVSEKVQHEELRLDKDGDVKVNSRGADSKKPAA
jgi:uncharacterized protein (TIGR02271 family)